MRESAVSELIGSLTLIAIIGVAVSIFAVYLLPTIQYSPIVKTNFIIACDNENPNRYIPDDNIDSLCAMGVFPCPGGDFEERCRNNCIHLISPKKDTDRNTAKAQFNSCYDACIASYCADPNDCRYIYICHKGGDLLELNRIQIRVNGIERDPTTTIIQHNDLHPGLMIPGDAMIIDLGADQFVDSVSIIYNPPSGEEIMLTQNLFGN